jgi:hypothetical protein
MTTTKQKEGTYKASISTKEAKTKARELKTTWASLSDKQKIEALYYITSRLIIGDQ